MLFAGENREQMTDDKNPVPGDKSPNIIVYTAMLCPFCHRAKQLLNAKGVTYNEVDVTFRPAERAAMREKAGGRNSVPQIFIDKHHVGGCDDLFDLDRAGSLDALLTRAV